MGHTPCARYIYLGFDSEVSCGCVNQYYEKLNNELKTHRP
jgi:hypothetical protein